MTQMSIDINKCLALHSDMKAAELSVRFDKPRAFGKRAKFIQQMGLWVGYGLGACGCHLLELVQKEFTFS